MKAAYLHVLNPEWTIGITFHTRSLYQQLHELVRRFTYDAVEDEPDPRRVVVLHSWGARTRAGLYSTIAQRMGITPRNFMDAKAKYGYDKAFQGICAELLDLMEGNPIEPFFDALLIDEGQDLPREFFQLAYAVVRPPKRIIWAYDELQNLSSYTMEPPETLFGNDESGSPRVQLAQTEGGPRSDVILDVCYRNSPWALTVAHALGFGCYRAANKDLPAVQMFDDPGLWNDIGYTRVSGALQPGEDVVLKRRDDCSPRFFHELLNPTDAVVFRTLTLS